MTRTCRCQTKKYNTVYDPLFYSRNRKCLILTELNRFCCAQGYIRKVNYIRTAISTQTHFTELVDDNDISNELVIAHAKICLIQHSRARVLTNRLLNVIYKPRTGCMYKKSMQMCSATFDSLKP